LPKHDFSVVYIDLDKASFPALISVIEACAIDPDDQTLFRQVIILSVISNYVKTLHSAHSKGSFFANLQIRENRAPLSTL